MTWMLTASGRAFDLGRPRAEDITVTDIAHHLALINRFNGATLRPYSVAEHSLFVAEIAERELGLRDPFGVLAALLHDAHEAYLGDIIQPVRAHVQCSVLEHSLERAVRERYGLVTAAAAYRDAIRRADLIALATERRDLMPPHAGTWEILRDVQPVEWIDLDDRDGMDWTDWRSAFSARFAELNMARVELMRAGGADGARAAQWLGADAC